MVDHCILSGHLLENLKGEKRSVYVVIHLIDEHGMVGEGVLRFPHQVQVGQSRLDHQHVGALDMT